MLGFGSALAAARRRHLPHARSASASSSAPPRRCRSPASSPIASTSASRCTCCPTRSCASLAHTPDQPFYPLYDNRTQRLVVLPAARRARAGAGCRVGLGFNYLAGLGGNVVGHRGRHARARGARRRADLLARRGQRRRALAGAPAAGAGARLPPGVRRALPHRRATTRSPASPSISTSTPRSSTRRTRVVARRRLAARARRCCSRSTSPGSTGATGAGPYVTVTSELPLVGAIVAAPPHVAFADGASLRAGADWTALVRGAWASVAARRLRLRQLAACRRCRPTRSSSTATSTTLTARRRHPRRPCFGGAAAPRRPRRARSSSQGSTVPLGARRHGGFVGAGGSRSRCADEQRAARSPSLAALAFAAPRCACAPTRSTPSASARASAGMAGAMAPPRRAARPPPSTTPPASRSPTDIEAARRLRRTRSWPAHQRRATPRVTSPRGTSIGLSLPARLGPITAAVRPRALPARSVHRAHPARARHRAALRAARQQPPARRGHAGGRRCASAAGCRHRRRRHRARRRRRQRRHLRRRRRRRQQGRPGRARRGAAHPRRAGRRHHDPAAGRGCASAPPTAASSTSSSRSTSSPTSTSPASSPATRSSRCVAINFYTPHKVSLGAVAVDLGALTLTAELDWLKLERASTGALPDLSTCSSAWPSRRRWCRPLSRRSRFDDQYDPAPRRRAAAAPSARTSSCRRAPRLRLRALAGAAADGPDQLRRQRSPHRRARRRRARCAICSRSCRSRWSSTPRCRCSSSRRARRPRIRT